MTLEFIRTRLHRLRLEYALERDTIQCTVLSALIREYEEQEKWLRQVHNLAIDHIDGDPENNDPANLRTVRLAENQARTGR